MQGYIVERRFLNWEKARDGRRKEEEEEEEERIGEGERERCGGRLVYFSSN